MKKTHIILAAMVITAASCKKDEQVFIATSTINVINAVVEGPSLKVNPGAESSFTWAKESAASDMVAYGTNKVYRTLRGNRNITTVSATDTTKVFYTNTIDIQQPINTLYLVGQAPMVETMFVEEKDVPYLRTDVINPDSSAYIRFVNLSPNSTPLNIKLTSAPANETSALAYKSITGFKKYSANYKASTYVFEVWNTAGTNKLASISLPLANIRFRTISVIIRGIMVDPLPIPAIPNQLSLFMVNYY